MASAEAGAGLRLVVKPTAGGEKLTLEGVVPSSTVLEVKEELAKKCPFPASEQRLIYKGQILKDERTVESYGIGNDHVLHLVRGRLQGAAQSGLPSSASSGAPTATGNSGAAPGAAAAGFMPGAVPLPFNPLEPMSLQAAMGNPQQMANMMQQIMSHPMLGPSMQAMMSNPELMRSLMQSNPGIQQLMDRNPELAQVLNNPAVLRETMQLLSNPNLMREHMRTTDRALSNIEALPGGFNALRQLYENVQEPLHAATTNAGTPAGPFGALLGGAAAAQAGQDASQDRSEAGAVGTSGASATADASTTPLPNPWAPPSAGPAAAPAAGGPAAAGAGAASGGAGGGGIPGVPGAGAAGLLGAGGMMGGMPDMRTALSMLRDPAMSALLSNMLATPGVVEGLVSSHPQLSALSESNPALGALMRDPEALRAMMNPQNIAAAMQMQAAMEQLGGAAGANPLFAGLMDANGGAAAQGGMPGAGAGANALGGADLGALLSAFGGPGFNMGAGGMPTMAGAPPADPEVAYAAQLQQLQDMGFYDRAANITALQATGGNVHAAVDRLLSGP